VNLIVISFRNGGDAKVVIDKVNVQLLMTEFDIAKPTAERVLKEHRGDVNEAVTFLLNCPYYPR
jgi:NACalpha-BTF3-like transcription factor